ncbi:MAG TPA: DUF1194 domain-containing protein [Crenalkalicoccus sp.]|jgi:hypothetical protein|nr:DUF1194 domain-containing protein [Crenalkalicoccus sp.]
MRRRTLLASAGLALACPRLGRAAAQDAVDMLLVLAVDVSRSVDAEEARLQRTGYIAAFRDPEVVQAITGGMLGAIAVAFLEWSGTEQQTLLIPWRRLAGEAEAMALASALDEAPMTPGTWTSISAAIDYSQRLIAAAPFAGTRSVVDVSGDGANNSGPTAEEARDRAVAAGITVNGLPIMTDPPNGVMREGLPLDAYYRQSVIGGPGAFMLPATGFEDFARAIRRKLVLEIAGLAPGQA